MKALDLICTECPLPDCDERSVYCVRRLLESNPNGRQTMLMTGYLKRLAKPQKTVEQQRTERMAEKIRQREYYQEHRELKLEAANARHARIRGDKGGS